MLRETRPKVTPISMRLGRPTGHPNFPKGHPGKTRIRPVLCRSSPWTLHFGPSVCVETQKCAFRAISADRCEPPAAANSTTFGSAVVARSPQKWLLLGAPRLQNGLHVRVFFRLVASGHEDTRRKLAMVAFLHRCYKDTTRQVAVAGSSRRMASLGSAAQAVRPLDINIYLTKS